MAVAGALELKVWATVSHHALYPTLYTILTGPPGAGKSFILNEVAELWRKLEGHHVAPTSITKAALIDSLNDAGRVVQRPTDMLNPFIKFNSLKIASSELGVLIPKYDVEFMSALTDLYDGQPYSERRRTADRNIVIARPQLTLLGATTPSYFQTNVPVEAWDGGFMSRTFLIFSGAGTRRDLFNGAFTAEYMGAGLIGDLKEIANLYGEVSFVDEVKLAANAWWLTGAMPCPDHPKLRSYTERRAVHLLKLCMVACASRGNGPVLTVTLDDYQRAMDWMVEAEIAMPDMFRAMAGAQGDARAMEEAYYFAYTTYMKRPNPLPEATMYAFLAQRVPSYSVEKVLQVMELSGMLRKELDPRTATIGYVPLMKNKNY